MMKKLISLFISICLLLSLVACYAKNEHDVEGTPAAEIITEIVTDPIETIATEETSGFVPSPEAPVLDFDITGFDITENYEGNPCLTVFFVWTNSSENTLMFDAEYAVSAFQDGIGLDSTVLGYENQYVELDENSWREIRPGATLEIAKSFLLRSDTTVVEVEVAPFFSFDGKPLMLLTIDTSAKG